jgi:DNA polymerase-1
MLSIPEDVTMLVGFNIKFDLLWELYLCNKELRAFFKRGGKIWDCQYVEYLIQAQSPDFHMAALEDVAESYGGTRKLDIVKELWESGKKTSEIPEDLLIDYLVGTEAEGRNGGDIRNTEICFLGQLPKVRELGMLPAVLARMDGLCATTEMEFNGLKIDVAEAGSRATELEQELEKLSAELDGYIPALPDELEFNWNSPVHVSSLLFGGTIKYQKRAPWIDPNTGTWARLKAYEPVQIGTYTSGRKKGEPKMQKREIEGPLKEKYQDFFTTLPGYTQPKPEWKTKNTDGAGRALYSTGEEVIEELGLRDIPFLKAMGKRQALVKDLGTYYVRYDPKKKQYAGMLTCVDPLTHLIHHKLNHTNTVTTRLSSSDPNLQNVSTGRKSQAKKMFVSRFGDDGEMTEADYSQLEVVIQGMLSGDPALCADLRNKIDFHCKRVSAKFGIPYTEALFLCKDDKAPEHKLWKDRRQGVKEFSFQRAYGAGAVAIAYTTGMSVEDVEALIAAEEIMYPGIIEFNATVEKIVQRSAKPFRDAMRGFRVFRRGQWQAPTGCLYSWRTWDAPAFLKKRGIEDSFSPPELKNYPVQGTGGEVVQMILGKLWRHFVSTDNYGGLALLVNTVHDCVWVDAHKSVRAQMHADLKRIMESVPQYMKELFGMDVQVPFPVEVECGPSMLELKHAA